jgi:hypothetical protein
LEELSKLEVEGVELPSSDEVLRRLTAQVNIVVDQCLENVERALADLLSSNYSWSTQFERSMKAVLQKGVFYPRLSGPLEIKLWQVYGLDRGTANLINDWNELKHALTKTSSNWMVEMCNDIVERVGGRLDPEIKAFIDAAKVKLLRVADSHIKAPKLADHLTGKQLMALFESSFKRCTKLLWPRLRQQKLSGDRVMVRFEELLKDGEFARIVRKDLESNVKKVLEFTKKLLVSKLLINNKNNNNKNKDDANSPVPSNKRQALPRPPVSRMWLKSFVAALQSELRTAEDREQQPAEDDSADRGVVIGQIDVTFRPLLCNIEKQLDSYRSDRQQLLELGNKLAQELRRTFLLEQLSQFEDLPKMSQRPKLPSSVMRACTVVTKIVEHRQELKIGERVMSDAEFVEALNELKLKVTINEEKKK